MREPSSVFWSSFALLILNIGAKGNAISLEENGPRFLDDWSTPFSAFSSRVGTTLRCSAHGQPHPAIRWVDKEGFPVQNVTGLREVSESGTVRFLPFSPEKYRPELHSAQYRCKATNPSGTIISPELSLRAVLDTPFTIETPDVYVIKGNTAILRCTVPSELADFVVITSWVQDNSVNIYPNFQTGKWLMLPSGELQVFNVEEPDGQKSWACRTLHKLTNEARTSKPGRIVVKDTKDPVPVRLIVEKERKVRVRAGEETFLSCLAEGNPPPYYSWFREKDGHLQSVSSKSHNTPSPSFPVLHLPQVRPEDGGNYICRVNNSHSADQGSVILAVYVPLRVQLSPSTQIVDVGRSASIRCLISGGPVHSIQWYKDGERLDEMVLGGGESLSSASNQRYLISPKEVLKLPSVHPEDAGMYQCVAKNDQSSAQDSAQIRLGSILPELVYRFSEQTIQPGPSVSLKCTAVGNPPPQFQWSIDGFPLPESERFLVGQYVTIHDNVISHVNITHSREEDGGLYTCQARNAMGTVSHSARLNIYGPPFVRPVPLVKAVAGKGLFLQCPVSGYPIESISWEKAGGPFVTTRMQRVYPNGTLILDHVSKQDEGTLTCSAKGRNGLSSSHDIHIRVIVPPKIMPFQFMNSILREGMRAAVSCQLLEGDRPIDLVWEFDGKPITSEMSNNGIAIRIPDEYSSTLVIDSLSSRHNGKFTCIAENSAGREQYSSELTVQIPPKWSLEPRDINISAGHPLTLHCQAEGHPQPLITWKRATGASNPGDYKDIGSTSSTTFANGTLRLDPVRKSYEGSYLCEARNGVGSGLSKVIFIKVNAPPQFTQREEQLSVRAGEKGLLQCGVRGDLPIQIEWSNKHGKIGPHTNHRYAMRHQDVDSSSIMSELIIASVDRSDGGPYNCRASNSFGTDYTTIVLNVQEPPDQPANCRITDVGSRSVGISWHQNFNGNSPLINFIIQSKFPSETWRESEVEELAVPSSQSSAVVEGLSPSTTYHLRVLSQNSVGFSPPSEVVQVTTTEEAPEGPPLDVKVEAESSTRLRVKWGPPERTLWHGQILGYYLGYRELSLALADSPLEPPMGFHSSSNAGDLHGYHFKTVEVGHDFGGESSIENLRKFARYSIVVQAFNAKGAGPSSTPVVGTTLQDVPSLPPEKLDCRATSPQSLHLTWEAPQMEGRHGVIQGYRVEIEALSSEDLEGFTFTPHLDQIEGQGQSQPKLDLLDLTPTENSDSKITADKELILHGLKKWTNYSMVVRPFTAVGEGLVPSNPVVCRTDEDVPSPPAALKGVPSSRRSILLSWLPPSSPNGRVTKYTVYMRVADGTKVEKKIVSSGERSLEWISLKEGTMYEFWVSATTHVGEGQATPRVRVQTTNKVPARIASFSGLLSIPTKKELSLLCLSAGLPEPTVRWSLNSKELHSTNKRELHFGANSKLLIKDMSPEDSGNYTCSVENSHGSDILTYQVKVLTPPKAPILQVTDIGFTDILLSWGSPPDGGSRVKGYLINYRREGEEWEEYQVPPKVTTHLLTSLFCGSTYQLFITAFNKIGSGLPSDILTRSTKGSPPHSPRKEDSTREIPGSNHSSIVIRLDTWQDKGCPIRRFGIEYKQARDKAWTKIPAELDASAKSYTLTGLHPQTRYEVRVTAGNHAGETVAKYEFGTGAVIGKVLEGGQGNLSSDSAEDDSSSWSTTLLIIFPSLLSVLSVLAVIAFVCYIRRKRLTGESFSINPKTVLGAGLHQYPDYGPNPSNRNLYEGVQHPGGHTGTLLSQQPQLPPQYNYTLSRKEQHPQQYPDLTAPYAKSRDHQPEYADDVCPYATFQLPENPPTRPLLTKGFHTGDTLYNAGTVYSGPYHSVQSQNFMATLPIRDSNYLHSLEDPDAEVEQILSYQEEAATNSPKYHDPQSSQAQYHPNPHLLRQQHHNFVSNNPALPMPNDPAGGLAFSLANPNYSTHRSRPHPSHSSSSTSTEESHSARSSTSPTGTYSTSARNSNGATSNAKFPFPNHNHSGGATESRRRSKGNKSSSNSGGSLSGGPRVRSSSGYSSSHLEMEEETSFSYQGMIQPPSRFSDPQNANPAANTNSSSGDYGDERGNMDGGGQDGEAERNKYASNRRKSGGSSGGTRRGRNYHIDV